MCMFDKNNGVKPYYGVFETIQLFANVQTQWIGDKENVSLPFFFPLFLKKKITFSFCYAVEQSDWM